MVCHTYFVVLKVGYWPVFFAQCLLLLLLYNSRPELPTGGMGSRILFLSEDGLLTSPGA
jgi:hypothetical protein